MKKLFAVILMLFPLRSFGESIEAAFSPSEGATMLVLTAIGEARKSILVAAYSFTSRPIARALVDARRRGIDVRVIVDKSGNRRGLAGYLYDSGIPTRVDARHAIFHDKYMVIDGLNVENGSFNFTKAAEMRNAENVLVIRDNPKLAESFTRNWEEHWAHSYAYR